MAFDVDAFRKDCLLRGLDQIGLTRVDEDAIAVYEYKQAQRFPWL
ncbi:hypothetical protein [Gimibacter soli]|uniref:3-isopropylmalate dehydratase small subunit n=1 Tax=Gimibacter soli TaxID=3024400 RepID=A0AAF0BLK3_9PROT|nr:hypothetical protein [Gimibacter soli]WCL53251.1 hypothetical protein PH603_11965 [Gimibacter soli]